MKGRPLTVNFEFKKHCCAQKIIIQGIISIFTTHFNKTAPASAMFQEGRACSHERVTTCRVLLPSPDVRSLNSQGPRCLGLKTLHCTGSANVYLD